MFLNSFVQKSFLGEKGHAILFLSNHVGSLYFVCTQKFKKHWLHTREMKNDIEGTCQLSKKYIQILFIKVHIVQNLLVQHKKQGSLCAMERHEKNRKKNHKILEEEDNIIRMKNMKGGNKKLLKKRLI